MPIQRLGTATPATNIEDNLVIFENPHLVSVVVTNKAVTAIPVAKANIFVIPANATLDSQYSYIAFGVTLSVGQSFETFRFAVNAGDTLVVRSTNGQLSFSCFGILQDDAVQPSDLVQQFTNKTIRGIYNTIYLDSGLTSERRVDAETGYVRYNTDFNTLEQKTPNGWEFVGQIVTEFSPDNSLNWDTNPTTIEEALNELASRLRALEP